MAAALPAAAQTPSLGPKTDVSTNFPAVDGLEKAAQQRRTQAERRLQTRRQERLSARAKLNRRLQEAYGRLAAAQAAAEGREAELAAAERFAMTSAPARARAAQRAALIARLLGQAADLTPVQRDDDPAQFIADVQTKLGERLVQLNRDMYLQRSDGDVLGRDGRARPARILRVGRFTSLAVGKDDDRATGFLREQADGLPIIVGPVLGETAIAALQASVATHNGRLPIDVDGALTRVSAEVPIDRGNPLEAGGIFVWPIVLVGLFGLLLTVERAWYFFVRPIRPATIDRVVEALEHGDQAAATRVVDPAKTDLDRILRTGIETFDASRAAREQALETALLKEEPALERSIGLLGAVAGLAPLLGLLGTVTGMIATFDVISTFGTGNPRLLSSGISVALITTQLGLIVAVPALLAHAWVSRAAAKRGAALEAARTALLSLDDRRSA